MVDPIINLISKTHHSCERREHAFIVLREYTIISRRKDFHKLSKGLKEFLTRFNIKA